MTPNEAELYEALADLELMYKKAMIGWGVIESEEEYDSYREADFKMLKIARVIDKYEAPAMTNMKNDAAKGT